MKAWEANSSTILPEHIVADPSGIAMAILRGDPSRVYPYMREIVAESGGGFLSASEAEIREARRLVLELEGIDICFSAATAVAGLIRAVAREQVASEATILINLTGSDRVYDDVPQDVVHLNKVAGQWLE